MLLCIETCTNLLNVKEIWENPTSYNVRAFWLENTRRKMDSISTVERVTG